MKYVFSITLISLLYVSSSHAADIKVVTDGKMHTFEWKDGQLGNAKVSDAPKFLVHFPQDMTVEELKKVKIALEAKIVGYKDEDAVTLLNWVKAGVTAVKGVAQTAGALTGVQPFKK
ncbi:MAG: hypothetical protein Q8K37_04955 [Alphaproteobacteria bacterium]|nr:hypothetical protein [Alphaproteobacteria bacterium]